MRQPHEILTTPFCNFYETSPIVEFRERVTLTMTPLDVGDQLDEYRLEELVACSGMASIFRATDTRSGTQVAVKIPHPEAECDVAFYDDSSGKLRLADSSIIGA